MYTLYWFIPLTHLPQKLRNFCRYLSFIVKIYDFVLVTLKFDTHPIVNKAGSSNGFALDKWQAITWTNYDAISPSELTHLSLVAS